MLLSGLLPAQNTSDVQFKFTFRNKIKIPFDFLSNLIVLPVRINNSDTIRLVLDTGLRNVILTDLDQIDTLLLNYSKQVKISGYGKGEDIDALLSEHNRLEGPGFVSRDEKIIVLLHNNFHLSSKLGKTVHGLIGGNVFSDYVLKIYYDRQYIELVKHDFFYKQTKLSRWSELPIVIEHNKPYVELRTTFGDTIVPLKYLIDTGASDAIWVMDQSHPNLTYDFPYLETYLGRGLNGDVHGKISRIKNIYLDKYVIDKPTASFPDSSSIPNIANRNSHGLLGGKLLKRFNIALDYKNNKMFIRKSKFFDDPFHYNMSGIFLAAPYAGLPVYEITDVAKQSPAEQIGIQKGDQVLKINGISAHRYTLNEIMLMWQRKEGARVRLEIMRNGQHLFFEFYLTDQL